MSRPKIALPPFSTTEIGSLPHHHADTALDHAFRTTIPFLPQIPIRNPREYMLCQALEGFPGLRFETGGFVSLDLHQWQALSPAYQKRLHDALSGSADALRSFSPTSNAISCWTPFLWELHERDVKLAKIQLAGPLTCQWVLRLSDGTPADLNSEISSQIFSTILARALAMTRELQSRNVQPIFFLDEPGLYGLSTKNPRHLVAIQELRLLVSSLQKEGVWVGIHCCGQTEWPTLLGLGIDILSIDVGLSFQNLLEQPSALQAFLEKGSVLSLGIIPTGRQSQDVSKFSPTTIVSDFEKQLSPLSPELRTLILQKSLYTPACGLALHSIAEADETLACLKTVTDRLASNKSRA